MKFFAATVSNYSANRGLKVTRGMRKELAGSTYLRPRYKWQLDFKITCFPVRENWLKYMPI